MNTELAVSKFKEIFKGEHEGIYFAPGRINVIGEHIDYNGGLVFPAAITLGTYALISKREDGMIHAYSMNFEQIGTIICELENLEYNENHNWVNYLKGMAKVLKGEGHKVEQGFNILIYGNIPNGSGLSSSASLEMLCLAVFKELNNLDITPVEAAILGKKVENEYIGVNSGIMDQFAISLGKKDQVILLDCNTLEYSYHPLELGKYKVVIMNTNKRRELADSKYNERRSECESALAKLQSVCSATNLCEVSLEVLEANKGLLAGKEYNRAYHVITENERVKEATQALERGDLVQLGQLLNASHKSLCEDYEVTGIELDTLVHTAWEVPGVLGARMTGAGFGGCSIALVDESCIEEFITKVGAVYKDKIGYEASFFVATIGDGPKRIG
nr:galactokinase [uncultured Niameybacter sp.]